MVLAQKRHINKWNGIENPEINLYIYGQVIYDKGAKNIQKGERTVSSINGAGKTGQPQAKE